MRSTFTGHGPSRRKIIEYIKEKGSARPHDLANALDISTQAVHAHLRKLLFDQVIIKKGSSPLVFYVLSEPDKQTLDLTLQLHDPSIRKIIEDHFMYITADGTEMSGIDAFVYWAQKSNPKQTLDSLAKEYAEIIKKADSFYNDQGLISGIQKMKAIFPDTKLDEVFYFDFYSLPKFGKTRLGQQVLHGKQSQDIRIMRDIARQIQPKVRDLIEKNHIDALVWTPHSIQRQRPFLKELKKNLALGLPEVEVVKAYSGDVLVAQKSLSRLEERIQNARETLFVRNKDYSYKKILIIDDAMGSGATLNEIANKIRTPSTEILMGLVLVGSYKGFEVINEV